MLKHLKMSKAFIHGQIERFTRAKFTDKGVEHKAENQHIDPVY